MFRGKSNSCGTFFTKNSKLSARRNSIEMDFGKKRSEAKLIRVGFREAKNETRREKRAKSVFRAKRKSAKRKTCGKNFFFFLRKSPYFLGKKRCLLKKGILVGRISSRFSQKPNTPSLHLLCLYNLLGFLGCSLLLGFPLAPTLRAGASPSRGSFCSLRSHPNGCRGVPL